MSNLTPTSAEGEGDGALTIAADKDLHTISLLVCDAPGVLVRVAMVFSRRGYNIESLVVSAGARAGFSRMTVTCSGDPSILQQMIKQLAKLVDVVHAIDHTTSDRYETEIALIKIRCQGDFRREILEIAEHFNAKVVDYAAESVILRVYGGSEKLDAMIALFPEEQIVELIRSGKIVMTRALEIT
ncbi:MAG: acetolactate synthase small subunit [Deltaproteobacteria bacterium]|jgi:acetolactate synthase-1/3 small subunit|nr:acetolactate synthase small subunit [Deltaproteobacteria bacterium]